MVCLTSQIELDAKHIPKYSDKWSNKPGHVRGYKNSKEYDQVIPQ